jgi:hypothetical protein
MEPDALLQMFPGQEVLPQVWLRNISDQAVLVPFEFDVRFRVIGPGGNPMPGAEVRLQQIPKGERTIAPGREERFGYDCGYRQGYLYDRGTKFDLTQPGKYAVEAVATSLADSETPERVWTGTVRSAPVAIAIRQVEMGPEVDGLRLGLVSYNPGKGGLPLAVVLRNTGPQPVMPKWDPDQMLHVHVAGPDGKRVSDDFSTICGPPATLTLQPGEVFCHAHSVDWSVIKTDKHGLFTVSLQLDVSIVDEFGEKQVSMKSNQLQLSRSTNHR